MMTFLALLSIFCGELLAILAEIFYTRWHSFRTMIIPMTIGGILLLIWYWLGYKYVKNIWIIYVVSITSILIIEPILISIVTWEQLTLWAKLLFILGVVWFLSTLFIK